MRHSVKVSTSARQALKHEILLGQTYDMTIAHLAGEWTRLARPVPDIETPDRDAVIKVSRTGYRFLQALQADMDVPCLGDVVTVLVEVHFIVNGHLRSVSL